MLFLLFRSLVSRYIYILFSLFHIISVYQRSVYLSFGAGLGGGGGGGSGLTHANSSNRSLAFVSLIKIMAVNIPARYVIREDFLRGLMTCDLI